MVHHNFVVDIIVDKLNLMVHFDPPFGVQIGNEDIICCNRIYQDVEVQTTRGASQNLYHYHF